MDTSRTKYAGLDIAKFLCSIVILLYHFISEHGNLPSLFEDLLSLYAVCVALFMVISGFLLYERLANVIEKRDRWKLVKKQVIRILTIYLLWSIPYLLFTIAQWDYTSFSIGFLARSIQSWVFGSTFYTIWFMPSLAFGIILSFIAIEKLPSFVVIVLCIVSYVVGSLNLTYSFIIRDYTWYESFHGFVETWLNGARGQFFFGFPLVTLGYYVSKSRKISVRISAFFSFLAMVGLLVEALILRNLIGNTGIDMTFCMIPAVYFITLFLISFPLKWTDKCKWLRNMSVLIFMSQRLFLTVLPRIINYNKVFGDNLLFWFIAVCGGTIVFSAAIISLSNHIRWMKMLY